MSDVVQLSARRRLRAQQALPVQPVPRCPHGLPVAYLDHSRKLNPTCGDCRRAENATATVREIGAGR